jgi:DNA-binding transcriptional regulator LsrR (DeoR family)
VSKDDLGERMRCVYVAMQHLQHGRSTVELGDELGLSRFAIGRMIRRARDEGLVRVEARLGRPIDAELSTELETRYGLSAAIVVDPPNGDEASVRSTIAAVAADYLGELVQEDEIVGVGPGRTIIELCTRIERMPSCDVVQLTGAADASPGDAVQAIARLGRVAGGEVYPLPAPFVMTDAAAATVMASQPSIRRALQRMNRIHRAVLTVGGWPSASLLAEMLRDHGDLDRLLARGAVAEIGTTVLDAEGGVIAELDDRMMGISTRQLADVPSTLALGGGPGKVEATIAVLRSGLVDAIVTDARTASAALAASR